MSATQHDESSASTLTTLTSTSHPRQRHRDKRPKKASDPFLDLPSDNGSLIDISPSLAPEHKGDGKPTDSLLADLVLAPLSMLSFVLSLLLVDRQQRQWRLSQHSASPETFWTRLSHWSWHGPQPYQDPKNSTWGRPDNTTEHDFSQQWYAHKKHRAIAKMEIGDAFEMRKRVVFALLAWATIGLCMLYYATKASYGWLTRQ